MTKKSADKKWSKKEYDQQLDNLQKTCKELDRQNEILRSRNVELFTRLNYAVSDLSKVLTNLTKT